MKLRFSVFWTVLLFSIIVAASSQRINRRQDTINEWIRTIRQSPKAHSLSPSWNGKSPYDVIGVGNLPLQNEEEDSGIIEQGQPRPSERIEISDDDYEIRRPLTRLVSSSQTNSDTYESINFNEENRPQKRPFRPKNGRQPQQGRRKNPKRPSEEMLFEKGYKNFKPFKKPGLRNKKRPNGYSFNDKPRRPNKRPELNEFMNSEESLPKFKNENNQKFPDLGSNPFLKEEHADFPRQYFEQPPRPKNDGRPKRHFKKNRRPSLDLVVNAGLPNQREQLEPNRRKLKKNKSPFRAGLETDFNENKGPKFPTGEEVQQGFQPYFRPNENFNEKESSLEIKEDKPLSFNDYRDRDEEPLYMEKRPFNGNSQRPFPPTNNILRPASKKTTPRPIPTPGPHDFPPPPPRRPRPTLPPPTHPPLPQLITHPPEHYQPNFFFDDVKEPEVKPKETEYDYSDYWNDNNDDYEYPEVKQSPNLKNHRPSFNSFLSDNNENKYSRNDYQLAEIREPTPPRPSYSHDSNSNEEVGFFEIPSSFPSLESLGAGFESMKIPKIRNKRSANANDDLMVEQSRPFRKINRIRHPRQRIQQRRQGDFGFQPGFWDEVDIDIFDKPIFEQRNPSYSRRGQSNQRPTYHEFAPFESYRTSNGRHRDHYSQQSVHSYPMDDFNRQSTYSNSLEVRDNDILGSGNFDVIQGGTFYDSDTYYDTRYNSRPQHYNGKNFFKNFKDFADIKRNLYRNNYTY